MESKACSARIVKSYPRTTECASYEPCWIPKFVEDACRKVVFSSEGEPSIDDNDIDDQVIAEDVDDDVEEEFNFHAMRDADISVSPITEVTEPASDYQS